WTEFAQKFWNIPRQDLGDNFLLAFLKVHGGDFPDDFRAGGGICCAFGEEKHLTMQQPWQQECPEGNAPAEVAGPSWTPVKGAAQVSFLGKRGVGEPMLEAATAPQRASENLSGVPGMPSCA